MKSNRLNFQRSLDIEERSALEEVLVNPDYSKRKTLIAFIIQNIVTGIDNLEIAKRAVKQFNFSESKDPISTTRSKVIHIIHDLNSSLSVSEILDKRGKGNLELKKWSDEKISTSLTKLHHEAQENFTYTAVKLSDKSLISVIEKRGSFQDRLINIGINPRVHLEDIVWGDIEESKVLLKEFLEDIIRRCGIEQLNSHSMETSQSAILGISDNYHADFDECKKYGCIRRVSGGAIKIKIEKIFVDYKTGICKLLNISKYTYEQKIERKRNFIGVDEYLDVLRGYLKSAGEDWTVSEFHNNHPVTHHGLHNNKHELKFINQCNGDVMAAAFGQILLELSGEDQKDFIIRRLPRIVRSIEFKRMTNPQARLEGYEFQKLFLKMLVSDDVGLRVGVDFEYEKQIDPDACRHLGHKKTCKSDFKFENFIIDTKRSVTSSERIYDQTQRYLDHTDHLIHVTLNQKYKEEKRNNKKLTTLTVFEFIERSHEYIGTSISEDWLSIFADYAKDSSKRIKKTQ